MSKLLDIIKLVGGDAKDYVTKNAGLNGTVAVTAVAAPELIQVIDTLSSGTDMAAAAATGGWTAYAAMAYYVIRFVIYLAKKSAK